MRRVGVIAAMPGELKPLVQGWKPLHLPRGESAWQGSVDGDHVHRCLCRDGYGSGRRACAIAARETPLDALVSMGWAGALSCGMQPGDAYVLNEVVDAASGEGFPPIHRLDRAMLPRSSWSPLITWPWLRKSVGWGKSIRLSWWIWRLPRWPVSPKATPSLFTASKRFPTRRAKSCQTSAGTPTARVSYSWRRCWLTSRSGPGTGRPWRAWGRMAGRARWRWQRSWVPWSVVCSQMIWMLQNVSPQRRTGAPHLARFSRDVGYHEP